MEELNFGDAIEACKKGELIARRGWNGKRMFVFMRPEDSLPLKVLLEAKSIPQKVKQWYANEEYEHKMGIQNPFGQSWRNSVFNIEVTSYLCMKAADNSIVNGWNASQADMLANDWYVLK